MNTYSHLGFNTVALIHTDAQYNVYTHRGQQHRERESVYTLYEKSILTLLDDGKSDRGIKYHFIW